MIYKWFGKFFWDYATFNKNIICHVCEIPLIVYNWSQDRLNSFRSTNVHMSVCRNNKTLTIYTYMISYLTGLRSREFRFTHMNSSTVDIPFLSEALSGERIWVMLKVANLMRKIWQLRQEKKNENNEKKLFWRPA